MIIEAERRFKFQAIFGLILSVTSLGFGLEIMHSGQSIFAVQLRKIIANPIFIAILEGFAAFLII